MLKIFLSLFVITTITFAILFTIEKVNKSKEQKDEICVTPYCIKAANYLVESINASVDPCEDFYQFVCGNWLENIRIPDDANVINSFRILEKQLDDNMIDLLSSSNEDERLESVINADRLYQSCINEENIELADVEPILYLINNELGGWPILQGMNWNDSSFDLLALIVKLRRYNFNFLLRVGTETDEKNSSITDITIGQGSLGLPQRKYYQNETSITIAYRTFMRNLARELANNESMIEQDVKQMFEFEKNISQYFWSSDEQRARDNETIRTTVENIQHKLNMSFDITSYLRETYQFANISLNELDAVIITEVDFLTNLSLIIDQTSTRILQNYFIWRFMMVQAENLPRRIRSIKEQFEHVLQGTTVEQARTVKCAIYVNSNMGFVVSKLYIKRYFDEIARNQSLEMIENIRTAFIDIIGQSSWMEATSKEKAVEKARAMTKQIGYPDYLGSNNNTKLENDYSEYRFNTSFIENVLKISQIKTKESLQSLHQPVDRKAWGTLPPTVINAFYEPSQNQITFPAGILQMPFFNKDAPKYLNFGGIGAVIGHEITHGFDDMGRQFDKDGNRIPWWTDITVAQFDQRKQCIIDQYSNYSIPSIHMNSNGVQTQGEDIADNGGLKASYFAYEKWAAENPGQDMRLPGLEKYSPEQLFFINFAHIWCIKMTDNYALNRLLTDVHSLGPFRVIGPTSNFDRFDQAFKCKPGQGNSRQNKCVVW